MRTRLLRAATAGRSILELTRAKSRKQTLIKGVLRPRSHADVSSPDSRKTGHPRAQAPGRYRLSTYSQSVCTLVAELVTWSRTITLPPLGRSLLDDVRTVVCSVGPPVEVTMVTDERQKGGGIRNTNVCGVRAAGTSIILFVLMHSP